jgi:large subunit ribosomal protein L14e
MDDIALGQIVHSRAGRDKNKYFIVIGIIDNNYVLIADGDLRKYKNPKKKKIKHLVLHELFAEDIRKKLQENKIVSDADLRRNLQSLGLY